MNAMSAQFVGGGTALSSPSPPSASDQLLARRALTLFAALSPNPQASPLAFMNWKAITPGRKVNSKMSSQSSLYMPYRVLGLICDGTTATCIPTTHQVGTAMFITTPTSSGRTLHLYDTELHLKRVSKPFPQSWQQLPRMSHLAASNERTFVALGNSVGVLEKFRPTALWPLHDEPISALAVIADLLLSTCIQGRFIATALPGRHHQITEKPDIAADITLPSGFITSHIVHPPTYLNKVFLAANDGRLLLLNLRSKSIVHVFDGFGSSITALVPSPAPDVVAIAVQSGEIYLHNIRFNETVTTFRHTTSPATTLSFRTDAVPMLTSADVEGSLYIWDLPQRKLHSQTQSVHPGGVSVAAFLPSEPVLLTSGASDNTLKMHIFDTPDGVPRLLRDREGHHLPPTLVRFAGKDGCMMLSAGLDCELRLVSVVREARNREFAQRFEKKGAKARKRRRVNAGVEKGARSTELATRLPPILRLATNELRQRDGDFASAVSVHEGLQEAYTWRVQDGASAAHVLTPPARPESHRLAFKRGENDSKKSKKQAKRKPKVEEKAATCVVMSPCGNYAIVGSQDGRVHSYNMQSGRHQGVYDDPSMLAGTKVDAESPAEWGRAHHCALVDIAVDSCGDILVSAAAADRAIKFWSLHNRQLDGDCITAPLPAGRLTWCKTSDLLAVACQDFCIYVYDASTRKLARKFSGHTGPIADLSFDPHGRHVLSAAMDSTIRTWDLPSGSVIDTFTCSDAPTSLAIATSGEYLATTHVNSLGISLWVDKSKFDTVIGRIEASNDEEDAITAIDGESELEEDPKIPVDKNSMDKDESKRHRDAHFSFPKPLSSHIATLSSKPLTHWSTLSNLAAIKERNKPIEPPKKPESAPFFLPTVKGLKLQFDVSAALDDDTSIGDSREGSKGTKDAAKHLNSSGGEEWANSEFGRLVMKGQYGSATSLLRRLDASGVDMEIRTLEGRQARQNAAFFFKQQLSSPQEYELTQAHLSVFLSSQGMLLAQDEGGAKTLQELLHAQEEAWENLRSSFESVMTLSAYFSGQV